MIFGNKMQVCPWHKCDIGFKYHHTGEEWDQHTGYAKIDIPKLSEVATPTSVEYVNAPSQSPTPTMQVQQQQGKYDGFFRKAAIVTVLGVWGIIVFQIVRLFV